MNVANGSLQRCVPSIGNRWFAVRHFSIDPHTSRSHNHASFAFNRPPPDFIIANRMLQRASTPAAISAALDEVRSPNSLNLLTAANKVMTCMSYQKRIDPPRGDPSACDSSAESSANEIDPDALLKRCLGGLTSNFSVAVPSHSSDMPPADSASPSQSSSPTPTATSSTLPPPPPPSQKRSFSDDDDPKAWRFLARGGYLAATIIRDRHESSPVVGAASDLLQEVMKLTTNRLNLAWHEHRSAGGVQSTTWPPARDISQICWSAGVAKFENEEFWRIAISTALAFPLPASGMFNERFVGQDLSQLVWAVARIAPSSSATDMTDGGHGCSDKFRTSLAHFAAWAESQSVKQNFAKLKSKEFTPLVWALAKLLPFSKDLRQQALGAPAPFWSAVSQRIMFLSQHNDHENISARGRAGLATFSKAEITTLAHSIATASCSSEVDLLTDSVPQDLSVVLDLTSAQRSVRALVDCYLNPKPPLPQFGGRGSSPTRSQFNEAKDLSMICWSCASVRIASDPLRKAVEEFIVKSPTGLDAPAWGNIVWALAKSKVGPSPAIVTYLGTNLASVAPFLTTQHIANICFGQATASTYSAEALVILGRAACTRLEKFTSRELSSYIWSAAILNRGDLLLPAAGTQEREMLRTKLQQSEFSLTEVGTTLWAATVLELDGIETWLDDVRKKIVDDDGQGRPWSNAAIATVYSAWIAAGFQPNLFRKGYLAFVEEDNSFGKVGGSSSLIHQRVTSAVSQSVLDSGQDQIRVVNEYIIQPQGLRVDIALLPMNGNQSKPVAIEVNGPSHYVTSVEGLIKSVNGPTSLKQRVIERLGWRVVHVEADEWRANQGDSRKALEILVSDFIAGKCQ